MSIVGAGIFGIFCLAALLSSGTGLYADVITETVSGTIGGGIDYAGIFGPPGANLTGDAATVTYMFDPTLLAADGFYEATAPTLESLYGFTNDEAITNLITVNGTTYTQTTSLSGQEQFITQNVAGLTTVPAFSNSVSSSFVNNLTSGLASDILTYSTTPYQYPTLLGNPKPFLDAVSATPTAVDVIISNINSGAEEAEFVLTPTFAPTPEPSSFGLLTVAVLFVGAITYQRKRQPTH
jgi:hypothetical protein